MGYFNVFNWRPEVIMRVGYVSFTASNSMDQSKIFGHCGEVHRVSNDAVIFNLVKM
jgi:hypothetical protein